MKLIIDIPEDDYEHIREYYEKNDTVEGTYSYIYHGTPIPDNATNGDVIKAMFPKGTTAKFATFMRFIDGEHYFNCSEEWWNAPYQKGGKERDYDVECRNHSEMIFNAQKGGKE